MAKQCPCWHSMSANGLNADGAVEVKTGKSATFHD